MFNGDLSNLGHFLVYSYTQASPGGGTFVVASAHDPIVGRKSADLQDWAKIDDNHVLVVGGIATTALAANGVLPVFVDDHAAPLRRMSQA